MKRIIFITLLALVFLVGCVSPAPPAQTQPAQQSDSGNSAFAARAQELVSGQSSGGTSSTTTPPATGTPVTTPPASGGSQDTATFVPGVLSADEQGFLENFLNRLQYMVYYDPTANMPENIAKAAVAQANRYLIEQLGRTVLDIDQLERLRQDQQTAYQAETGGSIDIMQYLAQKYNADVYIEIALQATSETRNGVSYGQANGSMKMYETSTGQLLGTIAFQSPQVRNTSIEAAINSAVIASVWVGMPRMIDQSKALIRNSMSNGVRYQVIIQNTPDSRAMSDFRRALGRVFREVVQESYSASETKIIVSTFQAASRVEDAIYDAADRAGMPDIYLLFSRGRSFTFNSGL
ncbi:MAG: hypothetical protein A2087_03445 [Spirochaetes bacterium GWD1_61_31]|nr:MAG: hypothetical protein A2Y37_11205 [Spirochaetes bacterium GWB1_60_80]OHD35344.1 MAG: hypothetical protein A2004_00440 [Spirochaetes bacterium GWC1_61_12]OHD36113.1 MAG: hypothetical protein A2087_03445 [Spirochaetes bacterium GWD1_61_31]OHD45000.1 MAG: hypothetical protein A2Y35_13250 [Spirochaetes bacterium GWE1_60_18]OHD60109.1 MAG: hypothetical protein A2Y32_11360 [Spirochaetes bacterium GWF1_60_12]HAP43679.1 hypothetical protein [Spirochaetaceae bacterium]